MSPVDASDALHARVRAFARGEGAESFEALALDVARHQERCSPAFARLCRAHGGLTSWDAIPAVPTDAFRLTRVASFSPELERARFLTSGTTGSERGAHVFRTTETYAEVALASGRSALVERPEARRVVVALMPDPGDPGESSLGFMARLFMRAFDGRERRAWLVADRLDVAALEGAAAEATRLAEPLLVLGASFAFVALLEALGDARIEAPSDTVVMQTGGFKGRTHEVDPEWLRLGIARSFGIGPERVVGEYGMTELSSQLYERTLHGGEPGVYLPPKWLRVSAVDPVTLAELPEGEVGLARFVDLANVDSAVAVLSRDLVRRRGGGVELLGRHPGAPPRGCSLALERLLER